MKKFRKEVILDFDYTLFDAAKFRRALASSLVKFGVSAAQFMASYPRAVRKSRGRYSYSFDQHIHLLKRSSPELPVASARQALRQVVRGCRRYLYPDTDQFLRTLRQHGFRLILVTHGNPVFQRQKLQATGIQHYFHTSICSNRVKIDVVRRLARTYDEVFFVSDHPLELEAVHHELPQLLPIMKLDGYGNRATARQLGIPAFRALNPIGKYIIEYYKKQT